MQVLWLLASSLVTRLTLGLALGARGDSGLVRAGAAQASVTAVFEVAEMLTALVSGGASGQEAGVSPYDNGDGKISLIVATPGGRHVFWDAEDLGTSLSQPPVW